MRNLAYLFFSIILISCNQGKFEKGDPSIKVGVPDTLAIYWPPLDYDSIYSSIREKIAFSGDDTLDYLPKDRDLSISIEYSGRLKDYLKHGELILDPFDSSYSVQAINDTLFELKRNVNSSGDVVAMYYRLVFEEPYYFTYIIDSTSYTVNPTDTVMVFMRSR